MINRKHFEIALLVFGGFFLSGSITPFWSASSNDGEQDFIYQLVYATIFAGSTFFLFTAKQATTRFLPRLVRCEWPIFILIFLSLISFTWSEDPGLTIRRSLGVLSATMFGVFLAIRFSHRELLRFFHLLFLFCLATSFLLCTFAPTYGVISDPNGDMWTGIYTHKNVLGRAAVFSLITSVHWLTPRPKPIYFALSFILSIWIIYKTHSSTAFAMALTLTCWTTTLLIFRHSLTKMRVHLLISALGLASIWIIVAGQQLIFDALGKDTTLSGRSVIWEITINAVLQRPFFGYGVNGFWRGWDGPSAEIWAIFTDLPAHAHNGFIDLALDLGCIGLVLALVALWRYYKRSLTMLSMKWDYFGLGILLYISFIVLYNLTESSLLKNSLYWALLVALAPNFRSYNQTSNLRML